MALSNNMVLSASDNKALAEVMRSRQPGDKMRLCVDVTIVENLVDRWSFDVNSSEELESGSSSDADEPTSPLAASVLGVMKKKKA